MSVWKDTIKNTPLKSNLRPSWDPLCITSKVIKFGKTELAEQNKQRTDTQCLICQLGIHSFDIKIKMAKTFCSYWKFLLYFKNRSQIWKSTCFVAIFLAYFFSVFDIWKFHFLVCNPFKWFIMWSFMWAIKWLMIISRPLFTVSDQWAIHNCSWEP